VEIVAVVPSEKEPALGSFALAENNAASRHAVDHVLGDCLSSSAHRQMTSTFGFTDQGIDPTQSFSAACCNVRFLLDPVILQRPSAMRLLLARLVRAEAPAVWPFSG
jgi:hypothetical protein